MQLSAYFILTATLTAASGIARSSLWVDQAPDFVRPYVIGHYANAQVATVGAQVYRFYITGPSSGGTFTLLALNSPASSELGVLPHIHERHHENFFNFKGRFNLWGSKDDTDVGRLFTAGDYGSVPINTTHAYQLLDPDTELVGVIVPGGFEDLFFHIADRNASFPNHSPYVPSQISNAAGGGSDSNLLATLEGFDVYNQPQFNPRRDFNNGTAPPNEIWHNGPSELPATAGSPYFLAAGYGPKYLTGTTGTWHVIQPFVTPTTGEQAFTQGTITISEQLANVTVPEWKLENHTGLQILEGSLTLRIGRESAQLVSGDVAFIPFNTSFEYWSEVAFTKFMYISAGVQGLDQQLLSNASSWSYPAFPTYPAGCA